MVDQVTLHMRLRSPWNAAILALAGLLPACEQEPPSPEALCKRAAGCEPMDLLLSNESCATQVRQRLDNVPSACTECVLGLPCSGMARIAGGKVSLAQICPACPTSVTAPADCKAANVLICGIALAPPPASASAAPSAAPSATASASAAAAPSAAPSASALAPPAPAAPALAPLPSEPKLPTVPVPPL